MVPLINIRGNQMPKTQHVKPSLLDVLVSALVDPRGVTKQLFAYDGLPPWVISTLTLFTCTCIVAPFLYSPDSAHLSAQLAQALPSVITTLLTFVCTSLFLLVILMSLNMLSEAYRTFSTLVYATAPFITIMGAMLLANKVLHGDLSLLGYLMTGGVPTGEVIPSFFPIAMRVGALSSIVILSQSLRAVTNSSFGVGMLLAVTTIPLVLGSFVVALTATDLIFPNSSTTTIRFFSTYVGIGTY